MLSFLQLLIGLLALVVTLSVADTVTPSNNTIVSSSNTTVYFQVARGDGPGNIVQALALTSATRTLTVQGTAILATPSNSGDLTPSHVALISCDAFAYSGLLTATDVFTTAQNKKVTAVVFYTETSDWCNLQLDNYIGYQQIYSLNNRTGTAMVTAALRSGLVYMARLSPSDPTTTPNGADVSNSSPLGPSPSTAVAMIVLYAITGVITFLFLLILISGAIRAHRHPDRYGPRSRAGRSRQTRAGGLARAVLDSIPIVKFGERQSTPKAPDTEMVPTAQPEVISQTRAEPTSMIETMSPVAATQQISTVAHEGIAAASPAVPAARATPDAGCSICTEDFEVGQDQRVLPCDHRFHPACIDPWLLNVSATCPLCRIDLRPASSQDVEERDETGSLPSDAGVHGDRRRRSVLLAITGLRRPDGMTREERISALRRYRQTIDDTPPQEDAAPSAEHGTQQDNMDGERRRQRLSRILNVRTLPWRSTT